MNKKKLFRNLIIGTFVSVPILSSFISTFHLVTLFNLGNWQWISILLALTFELGSIASFLALSILKHINRVLLWIVFGLLAFMQIIGNIFSSYDFIYVMLQTNPHWLDSFNQFMGYFTGNDIITNKMILSWLIGLPIPLVSLFFLKSASDYLELYKDEIEQTPLQKIQEEITPEVETIIDKIQPASLIAPLDQLVNQPIKEIQIPQVKTIQENPPAENIYKEKIDDQDDIDEISSEEVPNISSSLPEPNSIMLDYNIKNKID